LGHRVKDPREGLGLSRETWLTALTVNVVNRLARALGVTLATFFSPLDQPYRVRHRKVRRDAPRASR
jgi:hypothetical protein